ncbi:hypothetical protein SK128_017370 [Halocaridina rubra]|uniref:Uncharacterized protein n=1 Tax=Halocaridina rubra TaxID=373956 RepID=A0AAN8XCX2_HALRR
MGVNTGRLEVENKGWNRYRQYKEENELCLAKILYLGVTDFKNCVAPHYFRCCDYSLLKNSFIKEYKQKHNAITFGKELGSYTFWFIFRAHNSQNLVHFGIAVLELAL